MRLEKYIVVRPTAAMMAVIIEIMVQVIFILGIATKEIKEGRISKPFLIDIIFLNLTFHEEKFSKRLFRINRLNDAFQQLDKLTHEEALMAEAETLEIAARIDKNVIDMAASVVGIDEGVKDVRVVMESAQAETKAVHRQVTEINTGDIFYSSLTPGCVLSLTQSGVTEVREDIQVVLKHVDDRNRSYSPNLITTTKA